MSIIVDFTALLFQREGYIVSYCPELHVGSFGDSVDDALASLREAVECFLEGCKELGTLDEVLEEAGYAVTESTLRASVNPISRFGVGVLTGAPTKMEASPAHPLWGDGGRSCLRITFFLSVSFD